MRLGSALPIVATLVALFCLAAARTARAPASEASSGASFEGRTVVVTGANRGIGLAFAKELAEAGAKVVGTARTPAEATELAATGARVLQLDVTDARSIAAFAKALGDEPVDFLINNAGILARQDDPRAPDLDAVQRTIDVNLMGPIRVTYALLDNVLASDARCVVNITSTLGSIENNTHGGFLGYRESKAGLNMFSRSIASEYRAEGLKCVAVHPGWVQTDMGGENAAVTPEASVRAMLALIAELKPEQSGRYFNGLDGEALPW